jgi:5-methylcytosine-specific restriction enzyme A
MPQHKHNGGMAFMPSLPGHPCKAAGCGAVIASGPYCSNHQPAGAVGDMDRRQSSARRGYDNRWRKLRLIVLAEQPVCADPYNRHRGQVVPSLHVDHITPKREGGRDTRENLQGLCASCHSYKTTAIEGRSTTGRGDQISGT